MKNTTRITLSWELFEQGITKSKIAATLGRNRQTIRLWIRGIQQYGLMPFLDMYEQSKKGERKGRQIDALVKRYIWSIREREYQCCGQKIQYFLQLEHGIHLSVPKIYEILSEKCVIRTKWQKNHPRGPVPTASAPREVIQMDSIDFGELFAFTAVDIFTREADVFMTPQLTAAYGALFLQRSMQRRFDNHVFLLQTDGGSEFKAEFGEMLPAYCEYHRIARPYKKNEQSYIESFNRTVRKECLGWNKYRLSELEECNEMVELFLKRYHYHRPHLGLEMKTPLSYVSQEG